MMNLTSITLNLTLKEAFEKTSEAATIEKVFETKNDAFVGDCFLERGAQLIIRPDGTASWIGRVRSTDDDDEFKASVMLLKADGSKVFPDIQIGPFTIPRLFPILPSQEIAHDNTWYDWNGSFGFPIDGFEQTQIVQLFYEC